MTTQNELKYAAKQKGYFLDIIHHTKGKFTKKVEFIITNPVGDMVYTKTFKWTQNADYEYEVLEFVSNLPANGIKVITDSDSIDMILSSLMNDEETEETLIDGTVWDLFEAV